MQTHLVKEISILKNRKTKNWEVSIRHCVFAKFKTYTPALRYKKRLISNISYWKQFGGNPKDVRYSSTVYANDTTRRLNVTRR